MSKKNTMVIGATERPEKYANMAVRMLRSKKIPVAALGIRPGKIEDVDIITERPAYSDIHTVTLYVGPDKLKDYIDYILSLRPARVIFNPGTEDETFKTVLEDQGIEALYACTLVLLQTHQY
jgi:predicted CoA-binding protein